MDSDASSTRFQWRDRCGLVWDVSTRHDEAMLTWFARPGIAEYIGGGTNLINVSTYTRDPFGKSPMALIQDVKVDSYLQNRGTGSMLVRQAIEECKRRGYEGIEGDISSVDSDHFDKLKHFYKKLGFSMVFYSPEHPDHKGNRVGKIEMLFSQL